MPTFGQHETAQRLFLSGVGGIYALKADARKVIKVLHPPVGIWSEERIQEEIDGFRLRAKIQKAVAGASKNWAPIHDAAAMRDAESGEEGEGSGAAAIDSGAGEGGEDRPVAAGAYAVMDRYERSVQSLIDGKVNVNNADLRALFTGIIQGLLDLRRSAARPHGALKASNILLANSADLGAATVHLSDPAPDGALSPASPEKDLADLARILYQLVNLRPYDEGTIGRNKDWDELGPNGEDWRKLCHALLDTHAPAEERDLEKILPRIGTWTAKPKRSKKPMLLAAALLLLIAGGIAAYFQFRTPPVKFDQARWENMTLAYYSWFDDFMTQMYKPAVRDKFRKAPYPTEVARLFDDAGKELQEYDPESIARDTGREWTQRITAPTDYVKTGDGPRYTQKGLELIQHVSEALTPARWTVLTKLEETAKRYQDLGWQKPAGGIRAVIEAAKPPATPDAADIAERVKKVADEKAARQETIFQSVERTIAAAQSVNDIDGRWTRIQDQLGKLRAGEVPLLMKLPEFAQALPRSEAKPDDPGTLEDVTALAAKFGTIEEMLTKLSGALSTAGREVVYAELAKDPAADVEPSIEAFGALAGRVGLYLKLTDDPRVKVTAAWKTQRDQVQSDMADYLAKAAEAKVEGVQAHLDDLTGRRAALEKALTDAAAIPAIEKNRDALAKAAGDAAALAEKIAQDSLAWAAPFKTDPVQYVKEKRDYLVSAPLAKGTPAVYDAWKAAHGKFLDKVDAARDNLRKDYKYKLTVDDKFRALEALYAGIDAAIPVQVAGLSDIGGTDWRHTIAARVATVYRENALKDLLANLPPVSDDVPNGADPAFVSFKTQRLAAYDKSRADTLALLNDYAAITDRLDHLDLLANEPAAGAASWRDLYAKWGGAAPAARNPLLGDAAVAAALQPLTDRVAALAALDGVSDYKALLAGAQSAVPEVALAAWRKLGAAAVSEDTPALDDEDQAEAALAGHLAKLSSAGVLDAPRAAKLNAEIAAQRPIRWHRWADGLTTAAAIQTALDKADAFKVSLNPQADAALVFNRTYYALRKEFAKGHTEAELKPIAQKFIDEDSAMPAAISGEPGIKDLLARMAKSLSPNQGESSANGAGPQLAKWEIDTSRDGMRVFYFPSKAGAKFTLEFVRMQVTENNTQKTVYLCTTEMSVGLFINIMNTLGKMDDVDNDKHADAPHWFKVPPQRSQDVFLANGARSWRIVNRQFTLNENWLDDAGPKMIGQTYYPASATPAAPAAGDPMQLLTPWSAMYGARLLGCRLPTSDEWLAAYNAFEVQAAGAAALSKDVWNLRGEGAGRPTWRTQQDYTKTMETNGLPYPDKGIFLPAKLLFSDIQAAAAKPWTADALAKIAPGRITASPTPYQNSTLWFQPVDKENVPAGVKVAVHHLVGNVAEYVFDGDTATAVVTNNAPSTATIDEALKTGATKLFVIGGSSLSPPDVPFNEKQPVNPTTVGAKTGFCDVGFRLAYTAPIDSILDVLANSFKEPKYLPGPKAKG